MANRHISYENLVQGAGLIPTEDIRTTGAEEAYRVAGTLGRHGLIIRHEVEGIYVTGVDSSYSETKTVLVPEGWTLGYNCGDVWAVKPVHLIKDPLLRVMRQYRLGKERVQFVPRDFSLRTEMTHSSRGEGYVTFESGEFVKWIAPFAVATCRAERFGPVDQRYLLGSIYVVEGTPRPLVASFIAQIYSGEWRNYDKAPFRVEETYEDQIITQ